MEIDREETKNEINYRGIRAMPFVIGIFFCTLYFSMYVKHHIAESNLLLYAKIAGNETFEKLGTIGSSSNLLVYLTSVFHLKTITATNIVNIFNGTCNFGTLLGAFLSDTYFGRYNILGFASVSSFLVQ